MLGGGEAWAAELVRALPNAEAVSFPPGSSPEDWTAALASVETADVVVVALSATTITDPAWSDLAQHAVSWHTGLVIVVGDDTSLDRWPAALRDAMPATVDVADPAWPAELARVVADLEPSRPQPWTPPPRPPLPSRAPDEGGAPWPAPPTRPGPDHGSRAGDAFDEVRMDEDVQFTVYRPSAVLVDRWSWLLVFADTTEGSAEEPDPLAEVRRQAEGVLGAAGERLRDPVRRQHRAAPAGQHAAGRALAGRGHVQPAHGRAALGGARAPGRLPLPRRRGRPGHRPRRRAHLRRRGRRRGALAERARRRAPGASAPADEREALPQGVRVVLPRRHRGGRGRGERGPAPRRRVLDRLARPPQRRGLATAHRRADRRRRRLPALLVVERAPVELRAGRVPPRAGAAAGGLHPPRLLAGPVPRRPEPGPPTTADPPAALLPPGRAQPGDGGARPSGDRAAAARARRACRGRARLPRPATATAAGATAPPPPARPAPLERPRPVAGLVGWPPGGRWPRQRSWSSAWAAPPSGPATTTAAATALRRRRGS